MTPYLPADVWVKIFYAAGINGKAARKIAPVNSELAEAARRHEDFYVAATTGSMPDISASDSTASGIMPDVFASDSDESDYE